ncbi:MAG: nucleoside-diphosphate sugar epimerase [Proteobacteria bacterium]|nr:nucleoside-diphosphate sugar epimerase [Pseudomonadota bacterium]
MRRALVFGGSGQIGDGLLPLLRAADWDVVAVSRQARDEGAGLRWIRGALDEALPLPEAAFDAVFSLGPLDAFAQWVSRVGPVAPRIVAFGSTSIHSKAASADASERDVVQRLRRAEETLFAAGERHGCAISVLRPTLIHGRGRDRTLTRIAAFARRRGFFALPRHATGLRQPVHADDLAAAARAVLPCEAAHGRAYDLPGGETLPFDAMVERTLAALSPRPRLLRLPTPLFRLALAAARGIGAADGVNTAMLDRLDADLVFDAGTARHDFGYAPRIFAPQAEMFDAR